MAEYRTGRQFLFRLEHGCDLEAAVTEFVMEQGIRMGTITCVGALFGARIGYYDHVTRSYKTLVYDHGLEISAGVGNVSIKDGRPFVHLHVALTDEQGQTTGGHVMPGTKVFACEVGVTELIGPEQQREFDQETGLSLWPR